MKLSSNENIVDVEVVNDKGHVLKLQDIPKSLDEQLTEWLVLRNISPDFYIESEAKEMVLNALQDPDFESAYIDEENGLVINYKE
jgi:hypothetical protein